MALAVENHWPSNARSRARGTRYKHGLPTKAHSRCRGGASVPDGPGGESGRGKIMRRNGRAGAGRSVAGVAVRGGSSSCGACRRGACRWRSSRADYEAPEERGRASRRIIRSASTCPRSRAGGGGACKAPVTGDDHVRMSRGTIPSTLRRALHARSDYCADAAAGAAKYRTISRGKFSRRRRSRGVSVFVCGVETESWRLLIVVEADMRRCYGGRDSKRSSWGDTITGEAREVAADMAPPRDGRPREAAARADLGGASAR